jgi:NitT/TauT family transport system permease protein|tara:strand:- start:822 stop:1640 length:819 start_codon:yes stop_codon:yes gene_type:complete
MATDFPDPISPENALKRRTLGTVVIIVVPALISALLLAFWELWVRARDVKEYLLPAPSAVLRVLADEPGRFAEAAYLSLQAAIGGLIIASLGAFILGTAMAHSRVLERSIYPPALALKVTPIVAVVPLFTIWFGFGLMPRVLIAAMITFFPMLVNTVIGLRSVDPRAHDFLRALNASRWQIFWHLRVPSSLPYVFAGLRISVPLSLIGAVVAEFLSGSAGMGQLILIANGDFDTPALFGAVFVLAGLGIVLTATVALIERKYLFWHDSSLGA